MNQIEITQIYKGNQMLTSQRLRTLLISAFIFISKIACAQITVPGGSVPYFGGTVYSQDFFIPNTDTYDISITGGNGFLAGSGSISLDTTVISVIPQGGGPFSLNTKQNITAGTHRFSFSAPSSLAGGNFDWNVITLNRSTKSENRLGYFPFIRAAQSSTTNGGSAERAIDGNTNGSFYSNSVTHTGGDTFSWWQGELNERNEIHYLRIYNRTDCCQTRLKNFYIHIGDKDMRNMSLQAAMSDPAIFSKWISEPVNGSLTLSGISAKGKFVMIRMGSGGEFLSLAEVRAFGLPELKFESASQSSTNTSFTADKAIDGTLSFSHTNAAGAWWQGKLQNAGNIYAVKITNRTDDCCRARLSNFYTFISNKDMSNMTFDALISDPLVYKQYTPGPVNYIHVASDFRKSGQYIMIRFASTNPQPYLHLAEVQAFGYRHLQIR